MQKTFSVIEKSLVFLALIGFVFKLLIWKGGDISLLLGLGFLSILYFIGGYFQPEKTLSFLGAQPTASPFSILLKIFSGVAFSVAIIGLLFKLMFWQGATVELLVGCFLSVLSTLAAYLASNTFTKPAETAVFRRGAVITCLGIAAFLFSSSTIYRVFHRDDPQLVQKWIRMTENPKNPTYRAEFNAYRRHQYPTRK